MVAPYCSKLNQWQNALLWLAVMGALIGCLSGQCGWMSPQPAINCTEDKHRNVVCVIDNITVTVERGEVTHIAKDVHDYVYSLDEQELVDVLDEFDIRVYGDESVQELRNELVSVMEQEGGVGIVE